jgi:F-type H+-transporting ATPase subunit delta
MAEATTIARPYAQAVFEIARDEKSFDKWSDNLAMIAMVVNDAKFYQILGNPKIPNAKIAELLLAVCGSKISGLGTNFIKILVTNGRIKVAPQIAAIYEELRAEAEKSIGVDIVSAQPLSSEQQDKLASALRDRLKRDVHLHCRVDEAIIGGAIIRAGDQVIDGSVSGQLSRLVSQVI